MYEEVSGCRCMSVCVDVCVWVWDWEKQCWCWSSVLIKSSCSILHYICHMLKKILPQTVMVPRPYLRLPWRFLHPQVGKTHSPIPCPRMCPSRVGLVCHHVFSLFFFFYLNQISKSAIVHTFTCLSIFLHLPWWCACSFICITEWAFGEAGLYWICCTSDQPSNFDNTSNNIFD